MSEPGTDEPGTDEPGRLPTPETGDARVDDALRAVAGLEDTPVDDHAERLSTAHHALQEVLRTPAEPRPAGPRP